MGFEPTASPFLAEFWPMIRAPGTLLGSADKLIDFHELPRAGVFFDAKYLKRRIFWLRALGSHARSSGEVNASIITFYRSFLF